ncbi:MAG: M50 family metallopeptidase [Clostridia bacterium]|nr:M50 family metallopeptidase [Clostridia bacterium]
MKIRIDLKILFCMIIFYFTKQIKIYLIVMFFSFLHELGHIIVGIILKKKIEKIEIMPFGLSAVFYTDFDDKHYNIKEILVALAGPISSLFLAIWFNYIELPYITKQEAVYSNLLILFFNLIPLYPLDGGRIIKGIIYTKVGIIQTENIINKISNITMIVLTIISSITVYFYKNIAIFLVCIFLWSIVLQEKNDKTLAILQGK